MYAVQELRVQGAVAVARAQDGSASAYYPSGRKAVVVAAHKGGRKCSAYLYDDAPNSPMIGMFDDEGYGYAETSIYAEAATRLDVTRKAATVSGGPEPSALALHAKKRPRAQLGLRLNALLSVSVDRRTSSHVVWVDYAD